MAIKAIKLPNPLANILARDSWPVTLLRSAPILFCVGAMIVPFYTSDYAILAAPGGSIILCDFVYVTLVALCVRILVTITVDLACCICALTFGRYFQSTR